MAKVLLVSLSRAEKEWRDASPKWQRKIQDWETWKAQAKDRVRAAERLIKQMKADGESGPSGTADTSWEASFDPNEPSPQFSFAGRSSYSKSELYDDIKEMSWRKSAPNWALQALERGIAVHHAGMNKKYRSLVERYVRKWVVSGIYLIRMSSLFRLGHVRVMIATG